MMARVRIQYKNRNLFEETTAEDIAGVLMQLLELKKSRIAEEILDKMIQYMY